MDEELMKVLTSMEQRITNLEKAWNNNDEIDLIKNLTGALDASIKYGQRLEERIINGEKRISELEERFKKHINEQFAHDP